MSQCESVQDLISEAVTAGFDVEAFSTVEAHIRNGCDECRSALKDARRLEQVIVLSADPVAPDAALLERLLERVRADGVDGPNINNQSASPASNSLAGARAVLQGNGPLAGRRGQSRRACSRGLCAAGQGLRASDAADKGRPGYQPWPCSP